MANVVGDVAFLLRSDAILHNIRVVLEINPDLPPVRGDRVQLQQVLLNLLLNAFDAMKDCPVDERKITVRVEQDDARLLSVAVRDKGVGVSEDQARQNFSAVLHDQARWFGDGTLHQPLHHRGAWRDVSGQENNADRGATFYFTLPTSLVSHSSLTAAIS